MTVSLPATLSVQDAQAKVLEAVRPTTAERVFLSDALGRILVDPVVARVDVPPWDNSAMDGYAVRAAEAGAGEALPVVLDLPAGSPAGTALSAAGVARIMTGAPMPEEADAVVPVEETEGPAGPGRFAEVGEEVRFVEAARKGENVRRRGEDVRRGTVAVPEGVALGGPEIAMAAAVGRPLVTVRARPRVAVVATGDELVDVDEAGTDDRIVNGNAYGIAAEVAAAGGRPVIHPIVPDDPEATREAIRRALGVDAVVTIGGASVGEKDHVRSALEEAGVSLAFWRVALRPGGPMAFGATAAGQPVFVLPGNPVSALVTFELFVRPALLKMAGRTRIFRRLVEARLTEAVETRAGKVHYLRGRLERDADGWTVEPEESQGSGILSALVDANGLIVVPAEVEGLPAGSVAQVLPLRDTLDAEAP